MSRVCLPAVLAGTLLAALAAPGARAEEPAPPSQPAAPAPPQMGAGAPAAPAKDAPAAPQKDAAPAVDPRDKKIDELAQLLKDALRRIGELEKQKQTPVLAPEPDTTPPAPTPTPTPAPAPAGGGGGATLIPNISAIGNLIFGAGDTKRVPNRGRFNFDEFEVAFQDAVAPKLRYDVFLSASKGDDWKLGMEEGYLTASAIYPGLSARIGEIRTPFGKFNSLHSHVWPFITQPSASGALLGPDGLIADGAILEYNLPVKGFFAQAQLGGWQTASGTEGGRGFGAGDKGAYSARLWLGKELGRDKELELGFSRYQGSGDVSPLGAAAASIGTASVDPSGSMFGRFRKALTGVDLTYRNYLPHSRRLLMSAELMDLNTRTPGRDHNAPGGFAYLTYRLNEFYEAGIRGDYTRFPYPIDSYDWGGSLFLTKYITEQTSLRLEYQYTRSPLLGTGNGIYFQILFGSGPHAHPLQ